MTIDSGRKLIFPDYFSQADCVAALEDERAMLLEAMREMMNEEQSCDLCCINNSVCGGCYI